MREAERARREQREDCAKGRKRWRVKGSHAPVRPDDLVGGERLVAVAAEVERGAVRQHFNLDFADQRIDRFVAKPQA